MAQFPSAGVLCREQLRKDEAISSLSTGRCQKTMVRITYALRFSSPHVVVTCCWSSAVYLHLMVIRNTKRTTTQWTSLHVGDSDPDCNFNCCDSPRLLCARQGARPWRRCETRCSIGITTYKFEGAERQMIRLRCTTGYIPLTHSSWPSLSRQATYFRSTSRSSQISSPMQACLPVRATTEGVLPSHGCPNWPASSCGAL